MDYQLDSLECDEEQTDCVFSPPPASSDTPFLEASVQKGPDQMVEVFRIRERKELEIIMVVDSSGSMSDNLKELGGNMTAVLSHIQDKQWRMGFITADHGDHNSGPPTHDRWEDYKGSYPRFGKFMRLERAGTVLDRFILDHNTPEYEGIFRDTLTRGYSDCDKPPYCQGSNEQPLRALKALFSRYKTDKLQQTFFRPDTDTVVLIVTDEDERKLDSQSATTAEEVIKTYNKVFAGKRKRLFGFSISIQDERCYEEEKQGSLFSPSTGATYGHIVSRLAELTGGTNGSLCAKDYSPVLRDISRLTRSLVNSLTLQKIFYIPQSVRVTLDPPSA